MSTSGRFVDESTIECTKPAFPDSARLLTQVGLEVAFNGQCYTNVGSSFTLYNAYVESVAPAGAPSDVPFNITVFGGGFVDLVVAMDAGERGADLPAYVSLSLRHHLAGALDETTPLSDPETGALDEFVHTMIAEDEAAESLQLQQQLAQAVGVERLAAAAADAKDPVTAGRLYRAAGQGIKGGPKLRELLDKAVAEFKKSEGEGMASDLEARSWSQFWANRPGRQQRRCTQR